ncbi:hypothetical protein QQX09_03935 [Demequina sp. SYSU T00192]|uniref:Bacterial Ig-like domain-containing protein n=1 Tax=Demequina litoralis TaxID=3051660 RepID=A0ABT8G779_9MICO|nr:hypothetical protein [Demequina sp. SYSU T00192]MDN4475005.1 hypothetical protein [Demequina sp. SYSU T00192]
MRTSLGARALAVAATSALTIGSLATAASAADDATLTLSEAGVLTLPAGDGVRDETTVTVTSDIATTLTVYVDETGAGPRVLTYDPIEIVDPAVPATITVPVDEFAAGHYEIFVAPAAGNPAIALLTVGSGEPTDVSVSLSASTIFTWSGASPRNTTATVGATDETGLAVPFTGALTSTVGGVTSTAPIASTTGAAATKKVYAANLGAGTGSVTATVSGPADVASSATAPLTVARTAVTSLSLARSLAAVYPLKDDYRDKVAFTVTPATTRDTAFAATGSVKVVRDGKTVKSWTLRTSKKRTLTWDGRVGGKVVPGTYTVTASLKGPEGRKRTASTTVKVAASAVKRVIVKKTVGTVYPAKDSYRDTVAFTVTPRTTTGTTLPAQGTVKVVKDGKTVKSWTLTTSKKRTLTWDGRVGGAIVPGTYTVAVALKGPEGSTKKTSTTVNVSKKKLVTATKRLTYRASTIMDSYITLDEYEIGACYEHYFTDGDVVCDAYDAYYGDSIALYDFGTMPVPSEVVSAQQFGGASVKLTTAWSWVSGDVLWGYDKVEGGGAQLGWAYEGRQTLGALKLPSGTRTVHVTFALGEYATSAADTITATYTYKKLA